MKSRKIAFRKAFGVVLGNGRAQVAEMTLAPGRKEGSIQNNHRGADQWLYVLSGRGVAIGRQRRVSLERGVLLLIEAGNRHEIRNTGRTPLRTLNFYSPPAYDAAGNARSAGKPKRASS